MLFLLSSSLAPSSPTPSAITAPSLPLSSYFFPLCRRYCTQPAYASRRESGRGWPKKTTEKERTSSNIFPLRSVGNCDARHSRQLTRRRGRVGRVLTQRGWNQRRRQKKVRTSSNIFPLRSGGNCDARHSRQIGGRRENGVFHLEY